MAIPTRVQAASGVDTTFASSVTATFSNPNSTGNIILLAWEGDSATATNKANTPTDTAGNTYRRLTSAINSGSFDLEIWVAYNIKAQTSNAVTVTDTLGGADGTLIIEEWSGVNFVTSLDGSNSNTGNLSPLTSGNVTTLRPNDLLWVAGAEAVGANDLTAQSGYTNFTQTSTTFSNIGVCSQAVSAVGTYNGGFTSLVGVSWVCSMVALIAQDNNKSLGARLRPRPFSPGLAR